MGEGGSDGGRDRDRAKARDAVVAILRYLGEDPDRAGLKETPDRVLRSWDRIFGGYSQDPEDVLALFEEDDPPPDGQIVLLRGLEFHSTCEHHLLPFMGEAHVAYVPDGRVVGISKLARVLDIYSRRLQMQERIGNQVTSFLMGRLGFRGAACVISSTHLCMTCRGVEKRNARMVTSSLRGCFLTDPRARSELMALIGK